MADYLPRFDAADTFTATLSGTVTGGRLVEVSGVNTVAAAAADSTKVVGVASVDGVSGDKVMCYRLTGFVHKLTASGAITAGATVVSDTAGKVKSAVAATAAAAGTDLGTALLTTTTDGDIVDVTT